MPTLKEIMAEHSNPDIALDTREIRVNRELPEEKAHLAAIVDEAGELDAEVKRLQARLNELKNEIKREAKARGQKKLSGDAYTASISGTSNTWIPLQPAWDYIRSHGLNVDQVFSVKAGEFKKMVGETGLQEVGGSIETIDYYSVSFK